MTSRLRKSVRRAACAAAVLSVAGSPAGASSGAVPLQQWGACPPRLYRTGVLCATDDGGKTWQPIFFGGNYIFGAVRTSDDTGVVSTGAYGHGEWWTRDNGRHWYPTSVIGGSGAYAGPGVSIRGSGDRLYWAANTGSTVHQVEGWPPRGEVACAGTWTDSLKGDGETGEWSELRNICLGPPVNADMRAIPVLSVDDAALLQPPTLLPSGIAALFDRNRDPGVTLAIRDGDATHVHDVGTQPRRWDGRHPDIELSVSWPRLQARILWRTEYPRGSGGSRQAVSVTRDGGRTFASTIRQGWRWRSGDLPVLRGSAAAAVRGREIVLVGGRAGPADRLSLASGRVDAFDPKTGRWRLLPSLPVRVSHAMAASAAARIYVVGGFDRRGRPLRRAFVFEGGRWRALPRPPAARAAGGCALLHGKLYVVGGVSGAGLAREVLVFDLRRGRWTTARGPRPRAYLGVAAVRGQLVATGGRTAGPGTQTSRAESYAPREGRWRRLPPVPRAVSEGAAAAIGGRFVTMGGHAETNWSEAAVYTLDLKTRTWLRLPDLAWPSHGLAAAAVGRRLYGLGGSVYGDWLAVSDYVQFVDWR